jgi:hypothetical protein
MLGKPAGGCPGIFSNTKGIQKERRRIKARISIGRKLGRRISAEPLSRRGRGERSRGKAPREMTFPRRIVAEGPVSRSILARK